MAWAKGIAEAKARRCDSVFCSWSVRFEVEGLRSELGNAWNLWCLGSQERQLLLPRWASAVPGT